MTQVIKMYRIFHDVILIVQRKIGDNSRLPTNTSLNEPNLVTPCATLMIHFVLKPEKVKVSKPYMA
jgi:hypothetical protein